MADPAIVSKAASEIDPEIIPGCGQRPDNFSELVSVQK
jgi:hypothetical protein